MNFQSIGTLLIAANALLTSAAYSENGDVGLSIVVFAAGIVVGITTIYVVDLYVRRRR